MKFLVILLALSINHWWTRDRVLPGDGWYHRFAAWLYERTVSPAGDARVFFLAALFLPALAVIALLALLDGAVFGLLAVALHVALLLCLFDPQNLRLWVQDYLQHWKSGDYEAAFLHLQERFSGLSVDGATDLEAVHHQTVRYVVGTSFQRLFCVVFWYLFTGPAGALVYFSLVKLRTGKGLETAWENQAWVATLYSLLEWVPARLLGLTFALAGDFEAGFARVRASLSESRSSGSDIVVDCALAAIGSHHKALLVHESREDDTLVIDLEEQGEGISALHMALQIDHLVHLLDRSQIVWVAALAALAIYGIGG